MINRQFLFVAALLMCAVSNADPHDYVYDDSVRYSCDMLALKELQKTPDTTTTIKKIDQESMAYFGTNPGGKIEQIHKLVYQLIDSSNKIDKKTIMCAGIPGEAADNKSQVHLVEDMSGYKALVECERVFFATCYYGKSNKVTLTIVEKKPFSVILDGSDITSSCSFSSSNSQLTCGNNLLTVDFSKKVHHLPNSAGNLLGQLLTGGTGPQSSGYDSYDGTVDAGWGRLRSNLVPVECSSTPGMP